MDVQSGLVRMEEVRMDGWRKKDGLEGSYTVEAAWVMSVVLLAIVSVIRFAYGVHDESVGSMVLQEAVEVLRHGEEADQEEVRRIGLDKAGRMYSFESYGLELDLGKRKVRGHATGGRWGLEVEQDVFNPEGFLRMWALLEQYGEEGG